MIDFNLNGLTYLTTLNYDDNTKDVVFVCDNFVYSARCYDGIIQFVKGQSPEEPLYNGLMATEEQSEQNDLRRELFNGDHQILQPWIDTK